MIRPINDISKKYENLILFILERANDVNLGKKKLFKLLYFIDFDYYEKHEKSITGEQYVIHKYGPIPEKGEAVLRSMTKKKLVKPVKVSIPPHYEQHRFVPQKKADMRVFDGEELQHIEMTIERFSDFNGAEIEAVAKSDIPFQATKACGGKTLDYDLAFYRTASSNLLDEKEKEDEVILKSEPIKRYLNRLRHT